MQAIIRFCAAGLTAVLLATAAMAESVVKVGVSQRDLGASALDARKHSVRQLLQEFDFVLGPRVRFGRHDGHVRGHMFTAIVRHGDKAAHPERPIVVVMETGIVVRIVYHEDLLSERRAIASACGNACSAVREPSRATTMRRKPVAAGIAGAATRLDTRSELPRKDSRSVSISWNLPVARTTMASSFLESRPATH